MAGHIRVLAVTNHYPSELSPGDTPCIRDQIEALRRLGLEVEVVRIDRTRRRWSYLQVAARLFSSSFRRKRYDLVHAYYGYVGLLARLQFRCPVVVTFRGSDLLSRRNRRLGLAIARMVDGVIVMSAEMQRASRRADARIIPFGVDLERFAPCPRERARRELGLPVEGSLVLFPWDPSRPEKRFDVAQAAVEELKRERANVRLLTLWNETPETVAKYMNACDALVLVSDREGAPMAVREALACRLPVVSVDVGDVRRVIGDVDGCHICRQDVGDVAQKLRVVLDRGERLARSAMPDVKRSAEEVIEVYEAVLGRGRGT
jgi:glycosyltransferase involved in cell wall biosynthesis